MSISAACPPLPAPLGGQAGSCGIPTTINHTCAFQCSTGFLLVGAAQFCNSSNVFDFVNQKCYGALCLAGCLTDLSVCLELSISYGAGNRVTVILGTPVRIVPNITGAVYNQLNWAIARGRLPSGVVLNTTNGEISGYLNGTLSGTFNVTVDVSFLLPASSSLHVHVLVNVVAAGIASSSSSLAALWALLGAYYIGGIMWWVYRKGNSEDIQSLARRLTQGQCSSVESCPLTFCSQAAVGRPATTCVSE